LKLYCFILWFQNSKWWKSWYNSKFNRIENHKKEVVWRY